MSGSLERRFRSLDGAFVEFGIAGEHPSGLDAAALGTILTEGTDTIPARDFLAVAADECKLAVDRAMRLAARVALRGQDPRPALAKGRDAAHEAVVRAIDTWTDPPNAAATIRRKGKDDPLVNKGDLLDLTYAGYFLGSLARALSDS